MIEERGERREERGERREERGEGMISLTLILERARDSILLTSG